MNNRIGIAITKATLNDDSAAPGSPQPVVTLSTNGNGTTPTPLHYATDQNININPPITAPTVPDDILSLDQPLNNTPSNNSPDPGSTILPNNCDGCNGDTTTQPQAAPPSQLLDYNFGNVSDWIKANPWIALLIGGAIVYLLTTKK